MKQELRSIATLDNETLSQIIDAYYSGEKISTIQERYGIKERSGYHKYFPPQKVDIKNNEYNKCCEYCGTELVALAKHRDREYKLFDLFCPKCGHMPYINSQCQCDKCISIRNEKQKRIENIISEFTTANTPSKIVKLEDLDTETQLYLGLLIYALWDNEAREFVSLNESKKRLCHHNNIIEKIYHTLIDNEVIYISPNSERDAFLWENDEITSYDVSAVRYNINLVFDDTLLYLHKHLYTTINSDAKLQIWKTIAYNEAVDYLLFQLDECKLVFSEGEKTRLVFENLVDKFSLGQIYAITYSCVAKATMAYQKGLSRRHAANTVIGHIQNYAKKALELNWTLSIYDRDINMVESEITSYTFDFILNLGNDAYKNVPSLDFFEPES